MDNSNEIINPNFCIGMEERQIIKVDDMHGKGKSSQVKIKALELMINEKGDFFFGGKEKEIK